MKQVKYNETANRLLEEIIEVGKNNGELAATKQAIVHKAIVQLHKKEVR